VLGSLLALSTATKTLQQRNNDVYEALRRVNAAIAKSEKEREGKFDSNSPEWQKLTADQEMIAKKRAKVHIVEETSFEEDELEKKYFEDSVVEKRRVRE